MTVLPASAASARFHHSVAALAARLRATTGWRRAACAAGFGVALTAALPPIHAVPMLLPAFIGLLWLLDRPEPARRLRIRDGLIVGWWFGFGHFCTAHYWLANALLLDAGQYGWMVPFAVVGLAALLAVFVAVAIAAYRAVDMRGVSGVLALAVLWTAAEWLRGHVLTGFPWSLIGTAWTGITPMMQGVALVGLYGLGTLTVIAAALPSTLIGADDTPRLRWRGTAAAAVLLVLGCLYGLMRVPDGQPTVPDVALRLVQPNVPQTLRWDPALREANLQHTLQLSRAPGFDTRTHVIWPETAVPFVITDFAFDGAARRAALATVAPPGGLLVTGALRAERRQDGSLALWNSLHAIDAAGALRGTYDKHHLVPFGEYVPFRWLIGRLATPAGAVDFLPGPGPQTLDLPRLPLVSPLICYEAIFPGHVADAAQRPAWLLNVTNDAWFGISAGPFQHFAAARFRAVEEGVPLVRTANNGISAVVDSYGRIVARLGLGETGIVDAPLPAAGEPTVYSRWKDLTLLALILGLLVAAGGLRRWQ